MRCSTQWAGTITVCRPNDACRTSSGCGATRRWRIPPILLRQSGLATFQRITAQSRFHGATFLNCASNLLLKMKRSSKNCGGGSAFPSIGKRRTRRSANAPDARVNAPSFATSSEARRTSQTHRRSGTSTTKPPSRKLRSSIKKKPARITESRFIASMAAATCSLRRPVQSYLRPVSHSLRIPTTTGTSHSSVPKSLRRYSMFVFLLCRTGSRIQKRVPASQ